MLQKRYKLQIKNIYFKLNLKNYILSGVIMKGITSHTIKLDRNNISYENAKEIKTFTQNLKNNERLKIDHEKKTTNNNDQFENKIIITFTKTKNNNLDKFINKFKNIKNNILANKSLFHKPDSIESIFNHSTISVKRLNHIADEIKFQSNYEDMEKSFAEHNKITNPSDSIITGQKFSLEKNKITSVDAPDNKIPEKGNKDFIDDEFTAKIKKADDENSRNGEAAYLIGRLRYMGVW